VSVSARRRLRRLLRRAARRPLLEPLAWRIRARRRRRTVPPGRPKVADRRARIAVPPAIRAVEQRLAELAAGSGPIVAGPWQGSLEIELLYWIPFLRWFERHFEVDRGRVTAVSRPGAESWYADVCGAYAQAAEQPSASALSPDLLETVCGDYWRTRGPMVHVLDRLVYARAAAPAAAAEPALVLWPRSPSDDLLELAEGAEDRPVALLEPTDAGPAPAGVLRPLEGLSGADRTRALTAAVAGARLLVGPWDGRLMLGPMLGTPTLALTEPSSGSPHLDLADRAARALEGKLLLVDRSQVGLVARLAGNLSR
jgi:hypothetical protein